MFDFNILHYAESAFKVAAAKTSKDLWDMAFKHSMKGEKLHPTTELVSMLRDYVGWCYAIKERPITLIMEHRDRYLPHEYLNEIVKDLATLINKADNNFREFCRGHYVIRSDPLTSRQEENTLIQETEKSG